MIFYIINKQKIKIEKIMSLSISQEKSLLILPMEILFHIGYHLAKNPKDLAVFGKICHLSDEIAHEIFHEQEDLFKPFLILCEEDSPLRHRLLELQGTSDFNGLIAQAYQRNENSIQLVYIAWSRQLHAQDSLLATPNLKLSSDQGKYLYNPVETEENRQVCKEYYQAEENFLRASQESQQADLAHQNLLKEERIIAGKIHDLSVKIQTEVDKIKDFFNKRIASSL